MPQHSGSAASRAHHRFHQAATVRHNELGTHSSCAALSRHRELRASAACNLASMLALLFDQSCQVPISQAMVPAKNSDCPEGRRLL